MDLENAKAQMRKGVLEMCVLAVVAERETYPPEIIERLEGASLPMKEGTLYPLLVRLKSDGLVDYVWREGIKGPPRKYFTITAEGRAFLGELAASWRELVSAVDRTLALPASRQGQPPGEPPPLLHIEPQRPPDDERS
ncbi:MAG: PadR family transcriptional regulator [Saprospiraceae bacterium]|nr:PadR family transcriptional regulator [Saprospiraceae bacterium]MDW8229108.1 PadR family transcriptional regulator [Saprospiraceae bacterium]